MSESFIIPDWDAPAHVYACTTTRKGGVSLPPYDTFNLAAHVGDDSTHVKTNRDRLVKELDLPQEPFWLEQVHGNLVVDLANPDTRQADGSYTHESRRVCAVLTADCLPILLCNKVGTEIAALHAGWQSLAKNIIHEGVKKFKTPKKDILAWLGPAIGPKNFEVGLEVKKIFIDQEANLKEAFTPTRPEHFLANLYRIATLLLQKEGVTNIKGGQFCTFQNQSQFYSYRRDGAKTGRMATMIWLKIPL